MAARTRVELLMPPVEVRNTFFSHHKQGVSRINHGSFGSCPSPVLEEQEKWQRRCMEQPDEFFHCHLAGGLAEARSKISQILRCSNVNELVLVDNATTAAVMVAQQVAREFEVGIWKKGDIVLMLDCAYGAVRKIFRHYVVERAGGILIDVKMPFPVKCMSEVLAAFSLTLEQVKQEHGHRNICVASVDHITSMPAAVLPVREIVALLREHGVQTIFVDGAHAVGSVEVDVNSIGADFYTSNLHKWGFAPSTAALLHMRPPVARASIHHPIISHNYGKGIVEECDWVGTRDYSPLLAAPAGLDFINLVAGGIDQLMEYNKCRALEMGILLSEAWGTFLGAAPDLCCGLVMVGLPPSIVLSSDAEALSFRSRLRTEFNIEVPVLYWPPQKWPVHFKPEVEHLDGKNLVACHGFVRISHQVYNIKEDYLRLRDVVLSLCAKQELLSKC